MVVPKGQGFISLVLVTLTFTAAWLLAAYFHRKLPETRTDSDDFTAVSAQNYLKRLTGFGPRPAGSYANDVQAVEFLRTELRKLQSLQSHLTLEVDTQTVSGSFLLDIFDAGLAQKYSNLVNVIARVSSKGPEDNDKNRPAALLVNAHFDSVPQGPGASDDGANCAVMLETIRALLSASNLNSTTNGLKNDVVFLFNGAEESILPAAHGFITQHPWAQQVKAFINLEGAGAGGRELLFQSGPGNPWLLHSYIQNAPHPFASVIAQEIFQSGLIPSDTDFRVFRDYGHIPGLDIAYVKNGFVYHTEHDTVDRIPQATLQRVGDNLLAVVRYLAGVDNLGDDTSTTSQVFFDVFGLFVVSYPQWGGIIFNLACIALTLGMILLDINRISKKMDVRKVSLLQLLGLVTGCNLLILLLSIAVVALLAFLLGISGSSLSWYTNSWNLPLLYCLPVLLTSIVGIITLQRLHLRYIRDIENGSTLETFTLHAVQIFFSLPCAVVTCAGYNSGYIFCESIFYNLLYLLATRIYLASCPAKQYKVWIWFLFYLLMQLIPLMLWSYIIQLVFTVFLPIMGRKGASANPEFLIGIITVVCTFIFLQSFLPILVSFSEKWLRMAAALIGLAFLINIILVLFTNTGFPYSGNESNPSQKRMILYHTRRSINGNVDGGLLFARSDYDETAELADLVSEYREAHEATEQSCEEELGCSLPIYKRSLSRQPGTRWLSAAPPNITTRQSSAQLLSQTEQGSSINVTIELSGSNYKVAVLAPKPGLTLRNWSISDEILVGSDWKRDNYFIYFTQGLASTPDRESREGFSDIIWLQLEKNEKWNSSQSLMDIAITSQYHHGQGMRSGLLESVIKKVPVWVSISSWCIDHSIFSM